jgi:hypothetical protein
MAPGACRENTMRFSLRGTRRACGVNEIASDNRRDVKVGRTNST